jgi:hypothetical protein
MNNDFDVYDAPKMYAYLGFGPLTANNSWLTIDRRDKIANPGESKSIPLKVAYPKDAPTAMEISFNYCPSANYKYDVKLVDRITQTTTTIEDGTTYNFNASNTEEKKLLTLKKLQINLLLFIQIQLRVLYKFLILKQVFNR